MSRKKRITDVSRERYHALLINPHWDLARLRRARALIVGCGALGNEVAKNLAMMGVRLLGLLDMDTVEVANLTRSIFFRETDHGEPKCRVLARRVRDFNPDVEVMPLEGRVEEVLGLGLLRRFDLVFSCLDNRLARRALNRLCHKVGKPWVDGAMENLDGEVAVYGSDDGPCYECTLTRADREIIALAVSCKHVALANLESGKVPTTSTMGSIVAALQVQEALKVLHGDRKRALRRQCGGKAA